MNNCKYCKNEITDGITHQYCTNEELKQLNKSKDKNIPCMSNCGKFAEKSNKQGEVNK